MFHAVPAALAVLAILVPRAYAAQPADDAAILDGKRHASSRTLAPRLRSQADRSSAQYGSPAPAHRAERVIEIRAGRRIVTVTSGETILFKANGSTFAWTFKVTLVHGLFDLQAIAPAGVDVRGVQVYCVPDLYERAG